AVTVRAAGHPSDWPDSVAVPVIADDDLVAALDLGGRVQRALHEGNVVTINIGAPSVEYTAPDGSRRTLVSAESEHSAGRIEAFVSPDEAEQLGVIPREVGVVLVSDQSLTDEQI